MLENLITEPGIYDLPEEIYHADPVHPASLSGSGAAKIRTECPGRFWYERENPPPATKAMDLGKAAHTWLLEGDTFIDRFGVLSEGHDGRTKDGKAEMADLLSDGLIPLKHAEFEMVKGMHEALLAHPLASAAFREGKAEQSLFWRDPEFGIWCRGRPDFMPARGTVYPNYKTIDSCRSDSIRRAISTRGYHQQAVWTMDGLRTLGVCENPTYLLVFQEKAAPYPIVCAVLDPETILAGEMENYAAKIAFMRGVRTGYWPWFADDIVQIGLPGYAMSKLQKEADAGLFELGMESQKPLSIPSAEVVAHG